MKQYRYLFNCSFFLFFVLVYGNTNTFAQALEGDKEEIIQFGFDPKKGLGLRTTDNFFSLDFRFRMQTGISMIRTDKTSYDAKIKNLSLRFDGHLYSPKLRYKIQLFLAPDNFKHELPGEGLDILQDLIVEYQFDKNWSVIFGHTKLPGNRQQIASSGNLQLADRSINNAKFRLESDLGLHIYYKAISKDNFSYAVKTALSTGRGIQGKTYSEDSYSLTGKLELFPFGDFTNGGGSFEGDLARESKPKLMLSGAFHFSKDAVWSRGLKGSSLYDAKDLSSGFVDLLFKYKGWAAMFAYLNRSVDDSPMTQSELDPNLKSFAFVGQGTDYQLSYLFPSKYEITARFSEQRVHEQLYQNHAPDTKQWTLGATKYIWEHKIKLQTQVSFQQEKYQIKSNKDSWHAQIQIEVGI